MSKAMILIRFRNDDPEARDEYWLGETCKRNYCTYAQTTCDPGQAKNFVNEKQAVKSAEILNIKCSNPGRFSAVKLVLQSVQEFRQHRAPEGNDPVNFEER